MHIFHKWGKYRNTGREFVGKWTGEYVLEQSRTCKICDKIELALTKVKRK